MQQDNNHIENKLRQLENQQLPDLSQMDAHWQQMQATLSPGEAAPQKPSFFKSNLRKLLFAACIIAALLIMYVVKYSTKNNNVVDLAVNKNDNIEKFPNEEITSAITDTLIKLPAIKLPVVKPIPINAHLLVTGWDSIKQTNTLSIKDSQFVLPIAPGISLENFYNKIQKQAQQFVINTATGGDILAGEGTTIHIPPVAFVDNVGNAIGGSVTIMVEEYYKYSDMIAANLTTTSNSEQLITGGMIKLTAMQNNKEVELRADKPINLTMPTKNYDAEMKLFLADESKRSNNTVKTQDSIKVTWDTVAAATGNSYARILNWQLSNSINRGRDAFDGKTNFLNMEDEPVRVRETRTKRIAKFHITKDLPMSEAEAKKILKEKYGDYYDVIKVKKIKTVRVWFLFSRGFENRKHIGDSTRLTVNEAIRWRYITRKDSAFYAEKTKRDSISFYRSQQFKGPVWALGTYGITTQDTLTYIRIQDSLNMVFQKRQQVERAYSFTVAKMGWINCDRFYSYPDKTDFVLDLPADVRAEKFVTQIVFTKIRSVMPGQYNQSKIAFMNIPANMPVYVVGLGERNGKVVSFMQSLKTSNAAVAINTLEETTPEVFKEKLKQLDL